MVGLRGSHGWKYWRVWLGVLVLSMALPKLQLLVIGSGAAAWILIYAVPISAAFVVGSTRTLRAQPFSCVLAVVLAHTAMFLAGLTLAAILGFVRE